jgi:hypothetical protein
MPGNLLEKKVQRFTVQRFNGWKTENSGSGGRVQEEKVQRFRKDNLIPLALPATAA